MHRRSFLAQCAAVAAPGLAIAERQRAAQGENESIGKAARFLVAQQNADGSWSSNVYGAFKDGRALTPLVCLALARGGGELARTSVAKGRAWIEARSDSIAKAFPVHNCSWILQLHADSEGTAFAKALVQRLRDLQLNRSKAWDRGHPFFGGWSYAPHASIATKSIAPFQQPNLSATVLALDGLSAFGIAPDEPVMRDALRFVRRCQNLRPDKAKASRFDDGGFFQLHGDPTRNKAGVAGKDTNGNTRQRSYTSATADGLRGLVICGCGPGDAGRQAASAWLNRHCNIDDVPDLRHYAAYSAGRAFKLLHLCVETPTWPRAIARSLALTQRADGSWQNPAGEMRENDPLVASSLALLAEHSLLAPARELGGA